MTTQHLADADEGYRGLPAGLVREYSAARNRSLELWKRGQQSLPGAETRSVTHYWPYPTLIAEGSGARLVDVDGNEYLDLVNNYTSLIHGNGFEPAAEAIARAARSGTAFPSLHLRQIEHAEALLGRIPGSERVRYTHSGSEASILALRIARTATGRRGMTLLSGSYHGGLPPFTPGEPETRFIDLGDAEAIATGIDETTAAVFVEPFLGSSGVIEVDPGFLHAIAARAREVGALLVVDEVQALRSGPGGLSPMLGLEPDLVTLGKIIGGGLPLGAVAGKARYLDVTSPLAEGRIMHAGTFNAHLAACAAGLATLERFGPAEIELLNTRAERLQRDIERAASETGLPVAVTRVGSILNVHPGSAPVTTADDGKRFAGFRAAIHIALMLEGLYATPRGMINLSTALGEEELERVASGYRRAFERVAELRGLLPEAELLA